MATENILIKFTSDTSGIKDSITEMQKLGKITEEDAKKFQMMEGIAEGVADALKEAGIEAKTLNKEVKGVADSGKTLRTQFSEAKNEAVKLSNQFGAFSKEAITAAKKAALLKDEIADMNDTLDALNPEAKLNAFVKLGQGIQGGFQAATGALQVFGVENERITKLAQQFQGVLNLTQGINSVLQLKDVYGQLRVVLGVTTAAQRGLTVATQAEAVATAGATTATRSFTAALAANPFTLVAVALATLVGGILAYNLATDEAIESTDELNKETEEQIKLQQQLDEAYSNSSRSISRSIEDISIKLRLAKGDIGELQAKLEQLELNRKRAVAEFVEQFGADITGIADINKKFGIEAQILRAEDAANKLLKKTAEIPVRIVESFTQASLITDMTNAGKELAEAIQKELDKIQPISVENIETGTREAFEQMELQIKDLNQQILLTSLSTFDNLLDSQAAGRIEDLEREKKQGLITEEKFQKEVGKIRRRQALQDRAFAIFEVTINTAQAISKVLAQGGITAPPLIAAFSALGAAQIAAILSAPLPRFKGGTLNFKGGNLDADGGRMAILHPNEAVIPADRNKDYHPTIKALFNRQIKASEINSFVEARLRGKIPQSINAKINSRELSKALANDGTVTIKNEKSLAKRIGTEISNNFNPRRI
jgi:hypothetical protein